MKGIFRYLIIAIMVLALAGAAEAAIASSGGGLASSISGSGTALSTTGITAGHSATAIREAQVSLSGPGTLSASQSGTDAAIDSSNGASVSVNGATSASVTIGGTGGDASGYADAMVRAYSDQMGPGDVVETIISSMLSFDAGCGMTVTGRAVASGTARATGTWPDSSITAFSSGSTSAFGTVTGASGTSGTYLQSEAEVASSAATYYGGEWGDTSADIMNYISVGGWGSGSGSVSASGQAKGESTRYFDKQTSSASGRTGGMVSFRAPDEYGYITGDSYIGAGPGGLDSVGLAAGQSSENGAEVGAYSYMYGNGDRFSGSSNFLASGTATQTGIGNTRSPAVSSPNSIPGSTSLFSASGSASVALTQSGEGDVFGESGLMAAPSAGGPSMTHMVFPVGTYEGDLENLEIMVGTIPYMSSGSGIASVIYAESDAEGDSGAYRATSNTQANGKVVASGIPYTGYTSPSLAVGTDRDIGQELSANVAGSASTNIQSRGYGDSDAESWMLAEAALHRPIVVLVGVGDDGGGYGYPNLGVIASSDTAAASIIYTGAYSDADSSTILTSATGNAGALARDSDYGSLQVSGGEVSAETAAAGTVSATMRSAGGEAATASGIWGMSATGDLLLEMGGGHKGVGLPMRILSDFGITDSGLLTSSAVVNDGTGTTTASGRANGGGRAIATETGLFQGIEDDSPIFDSFVLKSSDSGSLTSDISAKDGEGNALASVRSGNVAGRISGHKFYLGSSDPEDFYTGINTLAEGYGYDTGSLVSGSASVTKGVSDDSGSYVRETENAYDETVTVFSMTTNNHLADPARSEFSLRNDYGAGASTESWACSEAQYNTHSESGWADAWGGFDVDAGFEPGAPLMTYAKASVKPVDLSATATVTDGGTARVYMKGGDGLASVRSGVLPVAHEYHSVIWPAVTTGPDAWVFEDWGTPDPNYAYAFCELGSATT